MPRYATHTEDLNKTEAKRVVSKLETLPTLPTMAAKVLELLTEEDPPVDSIVKLIETDQAMTIKVLKIINSAYYALSSSVSSIQKAVVMLGMSELRHILLSVTVSESLIKCLRNTAVKEQDNLWRHSLACAVCAEMITARTCPNLKAEAFVSGLLHDVGKLILEECFPDRFEQVRIEHSEQGTPWLQAEQDILGIDHTTVGKWLAEKWNLPETFIQAIWLHHHPLDTIQGLDFIKQKEVILAVYLADILAHEVMADSMASQHAGVDYEDVLNFFHIKPNDLKKLLSSLGKHYSERASILDIDEDEISFYFHALNRANQRLARIASENARYLNLKKSNQELTVLHDLHLELALIEDAEKILNNVTNTIASRLKYPEGMIYYLNLTEKKLIGSSWSPEKPCHAFSAKLDKKGRPILQEILEINNGLKQLIETSHNRFMDIHPEHHQIRLEQNGDTYCVTPLIINHQIVGEIATAEKGEMPPEAAQEEKSEIFGYLASITETALSRIKLIEDVRGIAESLSTALSKNRKMSKALSIEKERLAVTLRSIGDGVITTDTRGRIILTNKVAENLTGWTQDDAGDKLFTEVFRVFNKDTRENMENPVEKVANTGKPEGPSRDTVLVDRNGEEHVITYSGVPIIDKDKKVTGVVIVFHDVTHKERMDQELLRAQKHESLGVVAGGIAHDFNNILTAISGNVSLAKMYLKKDADKAFEKLAEAENASRRAKDLTRQLLTFSRKGGTPITKPTSIAELIKVSADSALKDSKVKFKCYLPDDLLHAEVDEGQINQVITNMMVNADQAMPEGGTITLKAENITVGEEDALPLKKGRYVKITMKDQGTGIAKEDLSKIFDPYFSTKSKHSGLGLAIAYSIISKHAGYVEAESELDAGATFYVYLPASEAVE